MFNRLLGISPYLEVVVRKLYWKNKWAFSALNSIRNFALRFRSNRPRVNLSPIATAQAFRDALGKCGICSGDLVVVHSSATELKRLGLSPDQVIDILLELIGNSGTLAMPAFPRYKEPDGFDRVEADVSNLILEYNVKKSIPWTGLLPLRLMKRKGAARSLHPLNTMVAFGPLAVKMMQGNTCEGNSLPCGSTSSWKFCVDNDAKVLALGVDMAHNLTMIHVAEDCYEETWPIPNWYRNRHFVVINEDERLELCVKERRPKWAMCYAERTLAKDLIKYGIQTTVLCEDIQIGVLNSVQLIDFLNSRKADGYPYFLWVGESRQ